eukprot:5245475-Amphidinium_carterae.2
MRRKTLKECKNVMLNRFETGPSLSFGSAVQGLKSMSSNSSHSLCLGFLLSTACIGGIAASKLSPYETE